MALIELQLTVIKISLLVVKVNLGIALLSKISAKGNINPSNNTRPQDMVDEFMDGNRLLSLSD